MTVEHEGKFTFKTGQLNFIRAWREWAKPAWESLPVEVYDLVHLTDKITKHLHQDSAIDMPWPRIRPFRSEYEKLSSLLLARASRYVYYYGHWGQISWILEDGAYWKFSNYADQILDERLQKLDPLFSRRELSGYGVSYYVLQGSLSVRLKSPNNYSATEIGYAIPETLVQFRIELGQFRLRQLIHPNIASREAWDIWADRNSSLIKSISNLTLPTEGLDQMSFDTAKFMVK